MNTSSAKFHDWIVDGEPIVVPNDEAWVTIMEHGIWDGMPVYYPEMKRLVANMLHFVRTHKDAFVLGLPRPGPFAKTWSPIILFADKGAWHRVHVERVRCDHCGAIQDIANPAIADLYFGVKSERESFNQAFDAATTGCARCGGKLPRSAMWAELCADE